MRILYLVGIQFYTLIIRIASLFNTKAGLWLKGRKNIFSAIRSSVDKDVPLVWFHASSLGEFEQGRPVMELIREKYPELKILLTFYSPSGYEIRKNFAGADYVFYLPVDTPANAEKFLDLINPVAVYFIKYEFWYFYLRELHRREIPVYLISAIFRPGQVFFKWYGRWYRNILGFFNHLYVQTKASADLLKKIGIENVTIAGDTRFDRVFAIAGSAKSLPEVEPFTGGQAIIVAGSTWPPDEKLLAEWINHATADVKMIVAPHEIHEENINRLTGLFDCQVVRYSARTPEKLAEAKVLVIDNIGMLSSLYKYGNIAYVGGGFGKGIHNILEPATFGMPVIFGPNCQKFREALELADLRGGFSISTYTELKELLDSFMTNKSVLAVASKISKEYVKSNVGATPVIVNTTIDNTKN
jgi:3-deoxy-D-manno-octulosonic-acid transferase